ncbi:MAG: zinc-dependent metalloprotease [Bacteroidota bacterium]
MSLIAHLGHRTIRRMTRLLVLACLPVCLAQPVVLAQTATGDGYCGTGSAPASTLQWIEGLHASGVLNELATEQVQNTVFLPIKAHFIATDAGTGRYTLEQLSRNLCELNNHYRNTGIQFFLRGDVNYINSSAWYNLPSFATAGTINDLHNVSRVINVYFCNLSAMQLCGFANFPGTGEPQSTFRQGAIYLSIGCSGAGNSTWAHEMGHFLSLPHPFQTTSDAPAAAGAERVTRLANEVAPRLPANCANAGDRFCDTPADFRPDRWNCPGSNGTVRDINNDLFTPVGRYYMSYADDACQDSFSVQQKAAMRATVTITGGQAGPRLYLLSPPIAPYDTIVDSKPTHVHPLNNSVNNVPNLTFRWNRVPGATMYLLRISRQFTFTTLIEDRIVYDTAYQYTGSSLNPNVDYYWSVKAINHKVTCGAYSASTTGNYWKFRTVGAASARDLVTTSDFTLFPNPAGSEGAWIMLEESYAKEQITRLECFDMQGRLVHAQNLDSHGTHRVSLPNTGLVPGLYTIRLNNTLGGIRLGRWSLR